MALNMPQGKAVYTTKYSDFKGVDYQSTDECVDISRFSDCDNLMFDKAGLIEKRLGFRCLNQLDGEIHSMKAVNINGKSELLIHAGSKLYKSDGKTVTPIKKEGYKRYSYLITLSEVNYNAYNRHICFDFYARTGDYKIKEMFMVKVSTLPKPNWPFYSGAGTIYENKTPEAIKDMLDSMTYNEIESYYQNALKTGRDAYYANQGSPEHYFNQIKNGNFEKDTVGFNNYMDGEYELYANSMRVERSATGNVYQHIPVVSISDDDNPCYREAVYYVTFLASDSFERIAFWDTYTLNGESIRTDHISPETGRTGGEVAKYNTTGIDADIGNSKSSINLLDDKVWITTENGMFVYDGLDVIEGEKLAHIPTTTALRNINHTYAIYDNGDVMTDIYDNTPGNSIDAVNLLTRKRVNTFALSRFGVSTNTIYKTCPYSEITLDSYATSVERVLYLTSNGTYKELDKMFYEHRSGNQIRFYNYIDYEASAHSYNVGFEFRLPKPHVMDGVAENLKVYFTATEPAGYEKKVDKCHITSSYGVGKDDRLFLTGNEKYPNYIWYSEFENFSYIPDINYIVTGDGNTKNLGFTKVNQNLLVHKESNDQDTTVFMVSGSLDSSGKAVFAVTQGINGVGAISEKGFANFDDMPLFLSDKGVYSVESTNIISEKTVVNRSGYVNPELLKHDLKNAAMTTYDDMVLVSAGGNIYVLYPRKQSCFGKDTVLTAASFEALRWSGLDASVFCFYGGGLYFGTNDGRVFKWNNDIEDLTKYNDTLTPGGTQTAVKCYFVTKLDDDGSFMSLKTMIKRGCGIMLKPYAQSSVRIFTLTEKEHENQIKDIGFTGSAMLDFDQFWFDVVDFSTRDSGRIIPFNTKVKKYSTLSFRVQNDRFSQGFGVIGIEKRYTLGNYKKY